MKTVVKKILVGLNAEAAAALHRKISESGLAQTQVVNRALSDSDKFSPDVEDFLAQERRRRRLSRQQIIESILLEAAFAHKRAKRKASG